MIKKSKLLIFSIPVIIILAGFLIYEYGIVNVYRQLDEMKEQHATKMKILEKCVALLGQKPLLEKQIVDLKQARKNEEAKMMAGQTIAIASANLQNTVKGIVTAREGVVNSERVEKTEEIHKFKIINVAVDAVFPDIKTLSDTLMTIETQTPHLVVKEVDVRVRNYNNPRELIVKLKVAALAGR
ncbi:MAG: type II secretion system protein GspM [Smithella sp.]